MKFRNQLTQSISALLLALAIPTLLIACGDSEETEESTYVGIDPIATSFKVSDFANIGFKVVKTYDVEGLNGAIAAVHGFQKDNGFDPISYELRFYNSHEKAVSLGTTFVEDTVGENAVMVTDEMMWTAGNK